MQNTIIRIPLDKLLPHPENPNRMAKANFEKLKRHIKQSHNYEPLIVRKHPDPDLAGENHFQIINGHHRAAALKQLGETFADCVQWDVDDNAARLLLATLNRLGGKDELAAKASLYKNLSINFSVPELSKLLPDTKQAIERLKDITKSLPQIADNAMDLAMPYGKAFLNTLIFFLNDEQIKIVEAAIEKATPAKGTKAERMAAAITIIATKALRP
ncbi:MAG: ParB/RepB/Spo0J family partition protein [Sedimentisphaerales bacterium]|jgi:ParB-like chromosome segregation protein Spo0J